MIESLIWFFVSPLLKWLTLSVAIGIGAAVAAWLLPQFRLTLILVSVGAFSFTGISTHFFRSGEQHMAQRIAAKDAAAVQRVTDAQGLVDACNGGLDWDVTAGTCRSTK